MAGHSLQTLLRIHLSSHPHWYSIGLYQSASRQKICHIFIFRHLNESFDFNPNSTYLKIQIVDVTARIGEDQAENPDLASMELQFRPSTLWRGQPSLVVPDRILTPLWQPVHQVSRIRSLPNLPNLGCMVWPF